MNRIEILGYKELEVLTEYVNGDITLIIARDVDTSEGEWFYSKVIDNEEGIVWEYEWDCLPNVEDVLSRYIDTVSYEYLEELEKRYGGW